MSKKTGFVLFLIFALIGVILGASAASASPAPAQVETSVVAGGSGDFYKVFGCQPPYAGSTAAKGTATNYDSGTGQMYHMSAKGGSMSGFWWKPIAIYLDGQKVSSGGEIYVWKAPESGKHTMKWVWAWGFYNKSCSVYG